MGYEESSGFCSKCNKNVLIRKKSPNYLIHFVLVVLTGGIWLIFLILVSLFSYSPWRCNQCGSKVSTGIFASINNNLNETNNHTTLDDDQKNPKTIYLKFEKNKVKNKKLTFNISQIHKLKNIYDKPCKDKNFIYLKVKSDKNRDEVISVEIHEELLKYRVINLVEPEQEIIKIEDTPSPCSERISNA